MSGADPTAADDRDNLTLEETGGQIAVADGLREAQGDDPSQGEETNGATPADAAIAFPSLIRPVSGRYRNTTGGLQLELRVDVDRTRPMKRVSGDFFFTSGSTTSYFGSFAVNSPSITVTVTDVTIKGLGSFTWAAGAPVVQVTIPRRTIFQPQAPATLRFFQTNGTPGAVYVCAFESIYFRTVRIETDRVSDVSTPVLASYNTGSLPSGGPARSLSVVSAYAEAGIQMIPTAGSDVINVSEAGANLLWSNAELHASMQQHFTLWKDLPQWAVWQLVAQNHEFGSGLYGIMFDQQGKQRQGCAVFHAGIGGTTADQLRLQLYTYVHELGHCFNLLHSWQKSLANPPGLNRPAALSWMNYPWYYAGGGAPAFWANFPFQYDNEEVVHLRHAFYNNIVMGGNDFIVGSALGRDVLADSIRDDSGLSLALSTHQRSFALGEPVVVELALSTYDPRGRRVHKWLHPNCGLVKIVIQKPSGEVVGYEPLIDHLVGENETLLTPGEQITDSAYIGFGKGGLTFDQPGNYRLRAVYAALGGSQVLSEILNLRVRYPVTAAAEELADLFMGEEQGALLYLLGSDHESLARGNEAFDLVLEKHAKSELAQYARLVKGVNAGRTFKTVDREMANGVTVRPAQPEESASLLSTVASSGVLDKVSNEMVLTHLAAAQSLGGNPEAATATLGKLSAKKNRGRR
jgi:hypothetical protein